MTWGLKGQAVACDSAYTITRIRNTRLQRFAVEQAVGRLLRKLDYHLAAPTAGHLHQNYRFDSDRRDRHGLRSPAVAAKLGGWLLGVGILALMAFLIWQGDSSSCNHGDGDRPPACSERDYP